MEKSEGEGERVRETENTEFKRKWNDEYLKTLCAFANADGGKMFIGLDDEGSYNKRAT